MDLVNTKKCVFKMKIVLMGLCVFKRFASSQYAIAKFLKNVTSTNVLERQFVTTKDIAHKIWFAIQIPTLVKYNLAKNIALLMQWHVARRNKFAFQ